MKVLKVLARSYVASVDLEDTVAFYEQLLGERCEIRFAIEDLGIYVAAVGHVHIIAGAADRLAPFREVTAAFFVDSVADCRAFLIELGAVIVGEPESGPYGRFMIVRHPDGMVAEYADRAASE